MKKFLSTLTAAVCVLACAFAFTACGDDNGGNDNQTHTTHTWSTTYTQDGDRHYQTCDGCDEKQYNNHDYGTSGVCVCGKEKPVTTVEVTGVTLDKSALTLEVDGTYKLTATVAPDNANDKTVTYTVEPTGIVTVDNNGNVTAVAAGTATITATAANNKTATCTVTVNAPLTNAQVLKYLNDNVLINAVKHFAENNIFSSAFNVDNISRKTWYITKDDKNITGANLVFEYIENARFMHVGLYNVLFSSPITHQNIKDNETGTPSYTKIYSNAYDRTIQAEHAALTNAICDNAARFIIDEGHNSVDPKLGSSALFTVIEISDKAIKNNSIAISDESSDNKLIENLNDTTKYYTYGEEKNVAITGEKLENNSEPFFGNSAD